MPFLPDAHYARTISEPQKKRLFAIAYSYGYDCNSLKRMVEHFDCDIDNIPVTRYEEICREAEDRDAALYWWDAVNESDPYDDPMGWDLDQYDLF